VPVEPLPTLPAGLDIFLDANIFVYAFGGQSEQCLELLFRCAREEVYGVTSIEVISEVTHRLMLAEALATGIIRRARAQDLRGKVDAIRQLRQYWLHVEKIFSLNLGILTSDESRSHRAQNVRSRYGLLTNDSLIAAAMEEYGLDCLASRDGDFDHISGLTIFKPTDI
jgi:predicted nucleic acid-binding protein